MLTRVVCLLMLLTVPVLAQVKTKVLVLPITVEGDYKPIDGARFAALLETKVEKQAPELDLILAPPGDPRLSGVDPTFGLEPEDAARLGAAWGTDLVTTVRVDFDNESKLVGQRGNAGGADSQGLPTSQEYRYVVTVAGLARVQIIDAAKQSVLLEGPVGLFCSDVTQHPDDGEGFGGLEEELAGECVDDLASRVIDTARRWIKKR